MDWKEKLRDLYLITVPDANDLFTKSITFNWGKFIYEPKEQHTEFYLTTKESIESFIENLLEQEKKRMSEEIRNTDTSELYDGDGETHNGWEQAKNYFLSIINKK